MENRESRKSTAVNFLIAVGGGGVKTAVAFISYCMIREIDLGTVHIYIHDADYQNGDCNQLRKAVENYETLHAMSNGKLANTEIILDERNLAEYMKNKRLNAMVSENDPRKDIMNGSTTEMDRDMDLSAGQYGRADIGAFNNIARRTKYKESRLINQIKKFLGEGKKVAVVSVGSCTGGTGASYTVDDVIQIKDEIIASQKGKNLYTAVALLGPSTSNPSPSEQQLQSYGGQYNVDSSGAFARTAAALEHYSKVKNLLPNDKDENYYLDRLYYIGNSRLDPGAVIWQKEKQDVHATHLLHFILATAIFDFYEHYSEKLKPKDSGVRTVRYNEGNMGDYFGWNNLSVFMKSEIVSGMRFCYIFEMEIIPLFSLPRDKFENNIVIRNWFGKWFGRWFRGLCLEQDLLEKISNNIMKMDGVCKDYICCFHDIQMSTELGTGRKVVKLFNQESLEFITKKDNSFFSIKNGEVYCNPDELTKDSWEKLNTNLSGIQIMEKLAYNERLCSKLKKCCSKPDATTAANEITEHIIRAVYDIAIV